MKKKRRNQPNDVSVRNFICLKHRSWYLARQIIQLAA